LRIKKPALITDTLKKYQNTLKFRKLSSDLDAIVRDLQANNLVTDDEKNEFNNGIGLHASNIKDIKKLTVSEDLAATHASLIKSATDLYTKLSKKQTVSSIME